MSPAESVIRFNAAIDRLHEVMENEFADLRDLQKAWALEFAAIKYTPPLEPWVDARDEHQLDRDEYVREMSVGGETYREGT